MCRPTLRNALVAGLVAIGVLVWPHVAPVFAVTTDNLVAYWSMGDASGNTTDDHDDNDLTETSGTIPSATGLVGNARDFEKGDSEWFEIADNTDLSTGDIDFTVACWVWGETLATFPVVFSKGWSNPATSDSEFALYYDTVGSDFIFAKAASTTIVNVTASNFGAASIETWYHVVTWHDSVNNLLGVSVNGTVNTAATTTGVNDGTSAFQIGAASPQAIYWDGLIDECGFWKRVLSEQDRTDLYNGGSGLAYPFTTAGGHLNRLLLGIG